jgi:hypothetical protein
MEMSTTAPCVGMGESAETRTHGNCGWRVGFGERVYSLGRGRAVFCSAPIPEYAAYDDSQSVFENCDASGCPCWKERP